MSDPSIIRPKTTLVAQPQSENAPDDNVLDDRTANDRVANDNGAPAPAASGLSFMVLFPIFGVVWWALRLIHRVAVMMEAH